jgi:hypothetical protein
MEIESFKQFDAEIKADMDKRKKNKPRKAPTEK